MNKFDYSPEEKHLVTISCPCPHSTTCGKHNIKIKMPDICGISGCSLYAEKVLQIEEHFFKVCHLHYPQSDLPNMPLEMQGKEIK